MVKIVSAFDTTGYEIFEPLTDVREGSKVFITT